MASWSHLLGRFLRSLVPGGPSADDEAWVRSQLSPAEVDVWAQLSGADRRHAVGVARRTLEILDGRADRPVVAAALLHDVGKIDSALGPFRRAGATVLAMTVGHERAAGWRSSPGAKGRVGRYLCHDAIGADLLAEAGSDQLTVTWAREHHLPEERWSLPADVASALKAADDD